MCCRVWLLRCCSCRRVFICCAPALRDDQNLASILPARCAHLISLASYPLISQFDFGGDTATREPLTVGVLSATTGRVQRSLGLASPGHRRRQRGSSPSSSTPRGALLGSPLYVLAALHGALISPNIPASFPHSPPPARLPLLRSTPSSRACSSVLTSTATAGAVPSAHRPPPGWPIRVRSRAATSSWRPARWSRWHVHAPSAHSADSIRRSCSRHSPLPSSCHGIRPATTTLGTFLASTSPPQHRHVLRGAPTYVEPVFTA